LRFRNDIWAYLKRPPAPSTIPNLNANSNPKSDHNLNSNPNPLSDGGASGLLAYSNDICH